MKLSEVRPCDNCGGAISPSYFQLDVSQFVINRGAVQEEVGLVNFFHGNVGLAEIFSPNRGITEKLSGPTSIILCIGCFASSPAAGKWDEAMRENG